MLCMATNKTVSFRLPEEYLDKYLMLKYAPGGFSKWVIDKLKDVEVDETMIEILRKIDANDTRR